MIFAYLTLLILASELFYMIAVHQRMGHTPYPFGSTVFCWIGHAILAFLNIWYCGWIMGLILTACDIFGIIHATIGWVFSIHTLPFKRWQGMFDAMRYDNKLKKISAVEVATLTPAVVALAGFAVCSAIITRFESFFKFVSRNNTFIIVSLSVLGAFFIIRIIVSQFFKK